MMHPIRYHQNHMTSNARDIALGTLLLIVAAAGIQVGVVGLLLQLIMPGGDFVTMLLPADSSLAALLTGGALLALLNHRVALRRLLGTLIVVLAVYHLIRNAVAIDAVGSGASWLSSELQFDTVSAIFMAVMGGCLVAGAGRPVNRIVFILTGSILVVMSALVLIQPQMFEIAYRPAPNVAPLLTLGFGIALLLIGWLPWCPPARVGVLPILAVIVGVILSFSAWLLLVGHQRQVLHERAEFLLDNIQYSAEQVVGDHLLLMRRLAQRIETADGEVDHRVLTRDVDNYFDDTLSLYSIALLEPDALWSWQTGRDPAAMLWLDEQVRQPLLQQWLAISYSQPRMILPPSDEAGMAIVAVYIPAIDSQLIAAFNMVELLQDEVRLHLGVYQARLLWHRQKLLTLAPEGQRMYEPPRHQRMAMRHVGLPGGASVTVEIYPSSARVWQEELVIPTAVSVAGLTLTWLLSFSLAMASLTVGRSRQLLAAQGQLTAQQVIQDMMVQESPLTDTLQAICDMVENQMADAVCVVRLADGERSRLEWAAGERLPEGFRQPLDFSDLDAQFTICGAAAASGELVISSDLIADMPAGELRQQASESGFQAGWSCPIVGRHDVLLGTLSIMRALPGVPSEQELALSLKAAGFAAMAVEKSRDSRALRTLERSVEASNNGVLIADALRPDYPIMYCNRAFCEMTGYSREEVLGRNCRFLQGEGTDPHAVATVRRRLAEQREVHVTLRNYRKDGTAFWNDLHISPVLDSAGTVTHFVGLQNNISERIAYEERLTYNASHDLLTGLPNRSMLEDRLKHDFSLARRQGHRIAVLFVDLDGFKPVNDTLGHDLGDKVLMEVADRLRSDLRVTDTVARLGGDEFVVVLPDVPGEQEALKKAESLLSLLANPYQVDDHELYLTASIGIALSNERMVNPKELIRHADMAMYRAKQKGHNNCQFFTRDITHILSDRIAMRGELQAALGTEQLQLHYQPLLNRKGELTSVEALLRWQHPQRGCISPAVFIPLAESTGQIIPISEWVLERACRDMCALSEAGLGDVKVAVNVSPLQFHRASFLPHLHDTLERTGLAAERLEVELTERIFVDDAEGAIALLQQLRSRGVGVSIDDFGTGFSSLAYLRALPINKVKIDRTFVNTVTTRSHDAAIVHGVVSMAHHMEHQVVAEGVETEEQWQCLLELGCDIFQGYLFAHPMPLDQLRDFIAAQGRGGTPAG